MVSDELSVCAASMTSAVACTHLRRRGPFFLISVHADPLKVGLAECYLPVLTAGNTIWILFCEGLPHLRQDVSPGRSICRPCLLLA